MYAHCEWQIQGKNFIGPRWPIEEKSFIWIGSKTWVASQYHTETTEMAPQGVLTQQTLELRG